jgi:sulfoxide reductase heme-binding subunit YedZ
MLRNIRFYILLASGLFSGIVYLWVNAVYADNAIQITKYTELYALTAVVLLYITLLIGPVRFIWKTMPYSEQVNKSRRALGVSAFYFALLHACFAFFGDLGGFEGLSYLGNTYLWAIILSFIALIILYLLAITSFDAVIQRMTFKRWKILQRFVYLAGVLILVHALLIGSNFQKLSDIIPQISFVALAVLFFLEAQRFDNFLEKKYTNLPNFGLTASLTIGLIFCFYVYSLFSTSTIPPLNEHASMQMSQDAGQTMDMGSMDMSKYPGMDGDKTKRYTTSFNPP